MDRAVRGCAPRQGRFGLFNALDYLIGAKLLNFAKTAESHTEFAQKLPEFVHEIREVFSLRETVEYVAQLERSERLSLFQRQAFRAICSASTVRLLERARFSFEIRLSSRLAFR
jgi:hypothetical protein